MFPSQDPEAYVVHRKNSSTPNEVDIKFKEMMLGKRQLHFTGLYPSFAAYVTAAAGLDLCKCDKEPCHMCRASHLHRCIALQQPYASVVYKTPPLYAKMFKFKLDEVPYHTLIVGYSAVFSHLRDLMNPDCPMLDETWCEEAREARTKARELWKPYIEKHREDLKVAFMLNKDPEVGRREMISAYQAVIITGNHACDYWEDSKKFHDRLQDRLNEYNGPLQLGDKKKFAKIRVSEMDEFNAKHAEWKLMFDIEQKLKI
jgi:hypothetical protein